MASSSPIDVRSHFDAAQRAHIAALVRHSVSVIESNQSTTGAYPASPSFPVYRYCWFRDGAFIADAMSRLGRTESADAFFAWCAQVVEARADRIDALVERRARGDEIAPEEFLPCRYTLEGDESSEEWWEFQLDGYGTWLWSLDQHSERGGNSAEVYAPAVELTVRYLTTFWDEPCYDWWEEHPEHRHTSTLAALYGGLEVASRWQFLSRDVRVSAARVAYEIRARVLDEGVHRGHLSKWLGEDGLDASLVACATPFRMLTPDEPVMVETVRALERELAHGGVHRYSDDTYFGGGEWLLLAAFLGWHYLEQGRVSDACAQLAWVTAQAAPTGDLPEQVTGHLLAPESYEGWVERWGPIATPLLWSHAMFVTLAVELGLAEADA
jgi:GH15 family glucan-1,4-alpha-glucosidase